MMYWRRLDTTPYKGISVRTTKTIGNIQRYSKSITLFCIHVWTVPPVHYIGNT